MDLLARRKGYKSYSDYLRSDHWVGFSNAIRSKRCYCCRNYSDDLQVHHKHYDRLGDEFPWDVVTVCGGCHVAIHDIAKSGTPLENAHHAHRQAVQEKIEHKQWVSWFDLLNHSRGLKLDALRAFLVSKGLSDGTKATPEAISGGFAKVIDGKERWNVGRYAGLVRVEGRKARRRQQHDRARNGSR